MPLGGAKGPGMSKYHPLDVRHPSNRRYLHKNYLLYPPAPIETRYAQGTPARRGRSLQPSAAPLAEPAAAATAPWGRAPVASVERGLGGLLRTLFVMGVVVAVIAAQSDLFAPLIRQLRLWAFDLGITLPF